jgi:hypothetical protein
MRARGVGWISSLAFGALALGACGREFAAPPAPPPALEVLSFAPSEGFEDDRVEVCARHLGTAQADFSLLAFFGTQPAEVLGPAVPGLSCPAEAVALRVPALSPGSRTALTLASPSSQTTSSQTFRALGPGHPRGEARAESLRLASAPSSIATGLPYESMPGLSPVLITNTSSRSLSLMDRTTGWHIELGLGAMPVSSAFIATGAQQDQLRVCADGIERQGDLFRLPLYLTALGVEAPGADEPARVEPRLLQNILEVFVPSDPLAPNPFEVSLAALPPTDPRHLHLPQQAPGDPVFEPHQIHQFCLTEERSPCAAGVCRDRLLVLTDLTRPRLALYVYTACNGQLQHLDTITLEPAGSTCQAAPGLQPPGPILDLQMLPAAAGALGQFRLDLIAEGRPEVWSVTLDTGHQPYGLSVAVAWPSQALADELAQLWSYCAAIPRPAACQLDKLVQALELLALSQSISSDLEICAANPRAMTVFDLSPLSEATMAVYFSLPERREVYEAQRLDFAIQLPNRNVRIDGYLPVRKLTLPSPAFALTAGAAGERPWLVLACEDGLRLSDLTVRDANRQFRALQVDGFLSLPGSTGSPLSLQRHGLLGDDDWDDALYADAVRDRLLVLPMGQVAGDPIAHPVGSSTPQVAASQFSDLLYVADPLLDAIRLVDERSGVQDGQFGLAEPARFGAADIACLHGPLGDVLLVPLDRAYNRRGAGPRQFGEIVTRGSASVEMMYSPDGAPLWTELEATGTVNLMAHSFNELLAAPRSDQFYLVSYDPLPEVGNRPLMWTSKVFGEEGHDVSEIEFSDDPDKVRAILPDWEQRAFLLPEGIRLVRLDPTEQAMAWWSLDGSGRGWLEVRRNEPTLEKDVAPPLIHRLEVPPPTAGFVSDLALHVRGEEVTLLFALPRAGHLLQLRPYLEPGGRPEDGSRSRQAFLETQGAPERLSWSPDGRRLYVTHRVEGRLSILELEPGLGARVRATLAVPANPVKVVFHPSGKAAYLTHAGSGEITVIR